jgi:hypothetical protein
MSKRLALIIRGEAFRTGGQYSRDHGSEASYDDQKAACKTHMDLVKKIESAGYGVDIFVDTYHTKFDNDLKSWYGDHLKKSIFHQTQLANQGSLVRDAIQLVKSANTTYDVIHIIRIDLYLKDLYIQRYNPDINTIEFFSLLWKKDARTVKGNPKLNDMIFHFPRRFFETMESIFKLNDSFHTCLDFVAIKYGEEYSFFTDNFYDSNSANDLNPFYKLVGRAESSKWHSEGLTFPKDF